MQRASSTQISGLTRARRVLTVALTASALSAGFGCESPAPQSARGAPPTTSQASAPTPSTRLAVAKRDDLFLQALGAVRPPAKYRLDVQPTSGDSILAAVRRGAVVNLGIFTGSSGARGMVNADGPRRAGDISCYVGFDQAGAPSSVPGQDHEDAAVLFRGSCTGKSSRDPKTVYRVGRGILMTESQIRARTADGSPIYLIDDSLATEAEALALLDQDATKRSGRRAFTIFTYFAENPADGGIVAIGTTMPVINP